MVGNVTGVTGAGVTGSGSGAMVGVAATPAAAAAVAAAVAVWLEALGAKVVGDGRATGSADTLGVTTSVEAQLHLECS